MWYRNFRGKAHKAADNWTRSGRAICGADISRPAFVGQEPNPNAHNPKICKHCLRKVGRK